MWSDLLTNFHSRLRVNTTGVRACKTVAMSGSKPPGVGHRYWKMRFGLALHFLIFASLFLSCANAAWVPVGRVSTMKDGGPPNAAASIGGCPDIKIKKTVLGVKGRLGKLTTRIANKSPRAVRHLRLKIDFGSAAINVGILRTSTILNKSTEAVMQGSSLYVLGLDMAPKQRESITVKVCVRNADW
jgi:hypothetical protein